MRNILRKEAMELLKKECKTQTNINECIKTIIQEKTTLKKELDNTSHELEHLKQALKQIKENKLIQILTKLKAIKIPY
ncbi:MAG: hypothetical protein ABIK73_08845 [candidate division WOR-3 bacterium]